MRQKVFLEEAQQEHSKKLQDCKKRQGMGAGCDDKAPSYQHTLTIARTSLKEIVDLLGGEEMLEHIKGWGRERLIQFFASLSNTDYGQNLGVCGRTQT